MFKFDHKSFLKCIWNCTKWVNKSDVYYLPVVFLRIRTMIKIINQINQEKTIYRNLLHVAQSTTDSNLYY